jgi:protein gp37
MNKTSIEFADYSWNPITGCKNGCDYCWAEKFNNRYFKTDFHVPVFHPDRIEEQVPGIPKHRNYIAAAISPDKPVIFTVDMGDIFSEGVDPAWISRVFLYAWKHPNANFLFLTKRPRTFLVYQKDIPSNVFIGTSLDFAHNKNRIESIKEMTLLGFKTFVNIEPLLSRMDFVDFSFIDFIIVGALTGRKYRPDPAWHKSIAHSKIYFKRNYIKYFPELEQWNTYNDPLIENTCHVCKGKFYGNVKFDICPTCYI